MIRRAAPLLLLLLAACRRAEPPAAPPPPPVPDKWDFNRPYLTRDHLLGYVASLSEERRLKIRALVPVPTGPERFPAGEPMREADEFARKYGFADYSGYSAVDDRIMTARMILLRRRTDDAAERVWGLRVIAANERLKREGLSEEEKKAIQRELFEAMEGLEEVKQGKPPKGLNEADVRLVAEYEDAIEFAEKRAAGR